MLNIVSKHRTFTIVTEDQNNFWKPSGSFQAFHKGGTAQRGYVENLCIVRWSFFVAKHFPESWADMRTLALFLFVCICLFFLHFRGIEPTPRVFACALGARLATDACQSASFLSNDCESNQFSLSWSRAVSAPLVSWWLHAQFLRPRVTTIFWPDSNDRVAAGDSYRGPTCSFWKRKRKKHAGGKFFTSLVSATRVRQGVGSQFCLSQFRFFRDVHYRCTSRVGQISSLRVRTICEDATRNRTISTTKSVFFLLPHIYDDFLYTTGWTEVRQSENAR